jgi:hypothetical protein
MRFARIGTVCLVLSAALAAKAVEEAQSGSDEGQWHWAFSPLAGWDRDVLKMQGPHGVETRETDTSPMYGLFAMAASPRLAVSDFFFATDVNQADILGNFALINGYGPEDAAVTWNVGAAHLYHHIKPENEDIDVSVPMLKAGPLFRIQPWHLALNPYVGYAWERVETEHGNLNNDSYLYGFSTSWRWRMLSAGIQYYYQDSQGVDKDFQTVRARFNVNFTRNFGAIARFDYMQHLTTDDTSVLVGPTLTF